MQEGVGEGEKRGMGVCVTNIESRGWERRERGGWECVCVYERERESRRWGTERR